MKKLLLICILIVSKCYAQTKYEHDTLYLSNGCKYSGGMEIHLGMGSNVATKTFNFIYTNPMSIAGQIYLPASWAGLKMTVKNIKEYGLKKTGKKYYLVLGGGNIVNYWCEIESALNTGEVIDINMKKTMGSNIQPTSVADELTKLKKLYDDGTLTKDEYETAKKKLLDQ
jgi:hypothetical protein